MTNLVSKRIGGSRSLKFLVLAVVTYAISVQFESANRALETPRHRRWESQRGDGPGEEDNTEFQSKSPGNSSNLRGDSVSLHDYGREDATGSTMQKQNSSSRRVPRSIAVDYTDGSLSVMPSKSSSYWSDDNIIQEEAPQIESSWYKPNALEFTTGYENDCEPMYDWQLKGYPTCNNLHALDLHTINAIGHGGSRIAFGIRQQLGDGRETRFVYKTVKYAKKFDIAETAMKLIEQQRRDSLVMERTSSSEFIPDIHAYCGFGVMMDFMSEGNMHNYIKGARLAGGSTLPPVDRLRLSIHVATSVADLHTIDGTPMPSISHNDIDGHQYLFQDGIFKLNDFNYAMPIFVNKKTNESCTRDGFGMSMWKARSFEEHQRALTPNNWTRVKPDVIDVWMMGNVIYYMLTDLYTFEKPENLSWQDSGRELLAGRRSPYPEHIEKSLDPSHIAVKKALDMCWVQNWKVRPSARSVSDYLIGQLKEITGEEKPDFRVVLPKRDPNQRSTESDYEKHND